MKKSVKKSFPEHDRAGFAGGILFGGVIFLVTIIGKLTGLFSGVLNFFLQIYGGLSYDVTWFGVILGGVYGFVTGFILFYLYSLIHERIGFK